MALALSVCTAATKREDEYKVIVLLIRAAEKAANTDEHERNGHRRMFQPPFKRICTSLSQIQLSCSSKGAKRASSHISIRESWIHVYAGGGVGEVLPPTLPFPTPTPAETAASEEGNGCSKAGGRMNLPRTGLLVEVAGAASISSREVIASPIFHYFPRPRHEYLSWRFARARPFLLDAL